MKECYEFFAEVKPLALENYSEKQLFKFMEIASLISTNTIIFWVKGKVQTVYPAGNYMFKVNNKSTTTRCEICSKLTIKTPERRQ